MTTKVSSKGQIVLPARLRLEDRIRAGEEFEIERLTEGSYRLTRKMRPNEGLVDWLLACPVKGFLNDAESPFTGTIDDVRSPFE